MSVSTRALLGAACICMLVASMDAGFRIPGSCTGPEDCQPDECCVLGMQRFSVPRCEKLGQIGDTCRPYNIAEDRVLYYPRGVQETRSTYTLLCPCETGLACSAARCEPLAGDGGNSLLVDHNYDDD